MGTTHQLPESDLFNDMIWGATSNGIVHLQSRLPLDVLYAESHNSGLIGEVWKQHHMEFANFISEFSPNNICEIGGGHGILSQNYQLNSTFQSWEIFEPNPVSESQSNVSIRKELFTEDTKVEKKDCFVHSHLFEHLYDHQTVLKKIHRNLEDSGKMIFSVPNLSKMVENGYVNSLNFEHVTYLTEKLINHILNSCGFKVIRKKYFLEDHSIFYAAEKVENQKHLQFNESENIDHVLRFFNRLSDDVERMNSALQKLKPDTEVFIFGAHIFSQFYLSNGLESSRITAIIDNDFSKNGKRLYGTPLFVKHPDVIRNSSRPAVLMKVGAYRNEIEKQLLSINPNTTLIE